MTHISQYADKNRGGLHAISATWAWVVALCTLGYMLPWAISASRGMKDSIGVFWLNLLAGWTVLGWFIALFWAFKSHDKAITVTQAPVVIEQRLAPQPAPQQVEAE